MELKLNKKYILHRGQPSEEVVTFNGPYYKDQIFVITKNGYTKKVSSNQLSEVPESNLSKAAKWLGSTLLAILVKEATSGLNPFKKKS